MLRGLFVRVRKSVNEYTGRQIGGNIPVTCLLIHRLPFRLYTSPAQIFTTIMMLSTKVYFFTQLLACCEQVAVCKFNRNFFGDMTVGTIANSAIDEAKKSDKIGGSVPVCRLGFITFLRL